jgi:hypothetical protein
MITDILLHLLEYPRETITAVAGAKSIGDIIVLALTYLFLWSMGWTAYSRWEAKSKIGALVFSWFMLVWVAIISPQFCSSRAVITFARDSILYGTIYTIIFGFLWSWIEERDYDEKVQKGLYVTVTFLTLLLVGIIIASESIMYFVVATGVAVATLLLAVLVSRYSPY